MSRDFHPNDKVIVVDGVKIGSSKVIVMAGPCSVENKEQIIETAKLVKKAGAKILRGMLQAQVISLQQLRLQKAG